MCSGELRMLFAGGSCKDCGQPLCMQCLSPLCGALSQFLQALLHSPCLCLCEQFMHALGNTMMPLHCCWCCLAAAVQGAFWTGVAVLPLCYVATGSSLPGVECCNSRHAHYCCCATHYHNLDHSKECFQYNDLLFWSACLTLTSPAAFLCLSCSGTYC